LAGLPWWREAFQLLAQILEVVRATAQAEHFFDYPKEVRQ
jgi:hypothetical protein